MALSPLGLAVMRGRDLEAEAAEERYAQGVALRREAREAAWKAAPPATKFRALAERHQQRMHTEITPQEARRAIEARNAYAQHYQRGHRERLAAQRAQDRERER